MNKVAIIKQPRSGQLSIEFEIGGHHTGSPNYRDAFYNGILWDANLKKFFIKQKMKSIMIKHCTL